MLLQTIRLGRHGFYGLGRGKNFTARGRRKDISALVRCAPLGRKILTPPSTVKVCNANMFV